MGRGESLLFERMRRSFDREQRRRARQREFRQLAEDLAHRPLGGLWPDLCEKLAWEGLQPGEERLLLRRLRERLRKLFVSGGAEREGASHKGEDLIDLFGLSGNLRQDDWQALREWVLATPEPSREAAMSWVLPRWRSRQDDGLGGEDDGWGEFIATRLGSRLGRDGCDDAATLLAARELLAMRPKEAHRRVLAEQFAVALFQERGADEVDLACDILETTRLARGFSHRVALAGGSSDIHLVNPRSPSRTACGCLHADRYARLWEWRRGPRCPTCESRYKHPLRNQQMIKAFGFPTGIDHLDKRFRGELSSAALQALEGFRPDEGVRAVDDPRSLRAKAEEFKAVIEAAEERVRRRWRDLVCEWAAARVAGREPSEIWSTLGVPADELECLYTTSGAPKAGSEQIKELLISAIDDEEPGGDGYRRRLRRRAWSLLRALDEGAGA